MSYSYYDLVTNLFLQIAIIIIACRIVIYIGKRYFGQTEVVCEMVAGLLLGPSVFGLFFPAVHNQVFPSNALSLINNVQIPNPSMTLLFALSQIGIVLYMFLTGLEFNITLIRKNFNNIGIIVLSGILFPFIMGAIFILLINRSELIVAGVPLKVAIIFFGAAISITAFPVLARIMDEKHITKTPVGNLALASGSLEDATAWGLVALVLTITKDDPFIMVLMLGGTLLYVIFIFLLGYVLRKKMSRHFHADLIPSKEAIAFVLIVLMLCSVAVDKIGLYSAFGAFLAGTVMPKGKFAEHLQAKFNYLTISFLLPIFFAFTGLNTKINLINTPSLWFITGLICLLALTSKLVICTLAAHFMKISWKDSIAYGVLMNTRGLMELVILNIGLQHKIITPTLFAMMVIMTFVTTLMTSPLISLIMRSPKNEE